MKEKTIFEKIILKEIPADIVYEDEKNIAFLDINPFEKGHVLVVPKKAYETIWQMSEEDFLDLQKVVLKISKKIRDEFDCGLNIYQNNLEIAHQEVSHVHFHLVPRKKEKNLYGDFPAEKYENEEEKNFFVEKLKI